MNLKLFLVVDRLTNPYAGTEGQVLLLVNQLLDRGIELHLVVMAQSEWLSANPLPCPVTVLGSSSIKNPINWFKLWRNALRLRKQGFGLAHVFFNDASVMCPPVFWSLGIRTIISRRDMGFWYNVFYRAVLPITGRFVAKVATNSQAVAEITRQVEKVPAHKMSVIYNGYDRAPALGAVVDELAALKRSGAVIVGIVANIRPIKRMQDAVSALGSLGQRFPKLHLVIVGAGDPSELELQASDAGVASRLHFLGSRPDVSDCLEYFDVGLLCSESEGFSNAIVEYQFAGLPVVCSDTGGNPEAVSHGITGYLYPVGDVEALAESLAKLISDRFSSEAMGAEAQCQARKRYSVLAMVDNHMSLYQSLLKDRR